MKRRESYPRDHEHNQYSKVDGTSTSHDEHDPIHQPLYTNNPSVSSGVDGSVSGIIDEQPQLQQQQLQQPHEHKVEFTIPLTWGEARAGLRFTLEEWNNERKLQKQQSRQQRRGKESPSNNKMITRLFSEDLDMILLAIPLSVLFVLLSFALPIKDSDENKSSHNKHFQHMQQAGSILFLVSSIISTWMTKRRRKVSRETDGSIERRRCVAAFLEGMRCRACDGSHGESTFNTTFNGPLFQNIRHVIPRKNVEDVYSTYRLRNSTQQHRDVGDRDTTSSTAHHATDAGQWHRIPSLLLVRGDFIALKVGDTAPAKCRSVTHDGAAANESISIPSSNGVIEAGERLTVESLAPSAKEALILPVKGAKALGLTSSFASAGSMASLGTVQTTNVTGMTNPLINNARTNSSKGLLPQGRTTLKNRSEELLLLANGVQIFVLLETPLDSFLRREDKSHRKSPQLIRQGLAIRRTFLYLSILAFALTTAFLLVRPRVVNNFFQSSAWTLPLLSALSLLPVMTPLYIFCLECIGTARILAMVHPLASKQKQHSAPKGVGGDSMVASGAGLGDSSSRATTPEHRRNGIFTDFFLTSEGEGIDKPSPWLLFRYLVATFSSRLFTEFPKRRSSSSSTGQLSSSSDALLSIPPASLHLLEKLGVVTALALIDDELACDPFSTPQQLLIPSGQGGMKLLDICPVFNEEDECSTDDEDNDQNNINPSSRSTTLRGSNTRRSSDVASLDSDDDSETPFNFNHSFSAPKRTLRKFSRRYRKKRTARGVDGSEGAQKSGVLQQGSSPGIGYEDGELEVQFEDPNWWQFLPSLKCIGLGCMLVEEGNKGRDTNHSTPSNNQQPQLANPTPKVAFDIGKAGHGPRILNSSESALVDHLCDDRERKQLRVLARCIGFSTTANKCGPRGDISCFRERRRLHILSANLLRKRMQLDSHALGLEESRNWSRLYTDADTVFVQDSRSGGDLILTVGDARVVTELCPDIWQGENSTISPLTASDRQVINDTQQEWMLSDLDVQAFSYAPLPYTADHKIGVGSVSDERIYLLDNTGQSATSSGTGFWPLVKNQIFLGLLGSSVRPRKEIESLILSSADAGVRFVYFSPRNMRRTKELASQMGIEVAWNCAISLRPLEDGTDDSFRMTSNYADWDVNARLPHGVEDVKRHLEDVDNVPLLVSLYTDVTKKTTAEMVS